MEQSFNPESIDLTGSSSGLTAGQDGTSNLMASISNTDELPYTTRVVLSPGPSCSFWTSSAMGAEEQEIANPRPGPSGMQQSDQSVTETLNLEGPRAEGVNGQEFPTAPPSTITRSSAELCMHQSWRRM